jgi:hypothetical protein
MVLLAEKYSAMKRVQAEVDQADMTKNREEMLDRFVAMLVQYVQNPDNCDELRIVDDANDLEIDLAQAEQAVRNYFEWNELFKKRQAAHDDLIKAVEQRPIIIKKLQEQIIETHKNVDHARNLMVEYGQAGQRIVELGNQLPEIFVKIDFGPQKDSVFFRGSKEAIAAQSAAEEARKSAEQVPAPPIKTYVSKTQKRSHEYELKHGHSQFPADRYRATAPASPTVDSTQENVSFPQSDAEPEVITNESGRRIIDPLRNVPKLGLPTAEDFALEEEQSPADSPNDAESAAIRRLQEDDLAAGRPPIPAHVIARATELRKRK